MSRMPRLTADVCEDIYKLSQRGFEPEEVGKYSHSSGGSAKRVMSVYRALVADDFDKAIRACQGNEKSPILLWGLEKLHKKMPEKETNQDEQLSIEAEQDSSELATESDTATDSKPSADIMYALSKIDERLETICFYLESLHKEQNANSDNIYKVIANMNNSVLMEMRKRKNRI